MKIGLMGFGRIGRNVFRQLHDRPPGDVEVGAIVDVADPEALTYLLKYDSIYGRFPKPVALVDGALEVDGRRIPFVSAKAPGDVDWSAYDVDVVVQAVGRYRTAEETRRHLERGAKRVILASTPERPGELPILLKGVNDEVLGPDTQVIAMGSNTSNALAPVLVALDEAFGLDRVFFTTVHAFTNQERLADVPGTGLRTSRAAGENIIPQRTNSPEILEQVLPAMRGKLTGMALNVPVPDGSTVDLVARLARPADKDAVNATMEAAASGRFARILDYSTDPIVSSDVVGVTASGVWDSLATMVLDGTLLKGIVWFDNGWGYAARIVETLDELARQEVAA